MRLPPCPHLLPPDSNHGPERYSSEPTVFENYVHDIYVDDQVVELSLWDTAGMSRTLCVPVPRLTDISGVLLVFH